MKKKHVLMALAIIVLGALISVLAQSAILATPGKSSFGQLVKATKTFVIPKALRDAPTAHNVDLSTAQVSTGDNGRLVVSMDAKGDLPGSFTLTLDRSPDGKTITGGYWALVVSHTKLIPMAPGEGDGDGYNEVLEQIGTLSGNISGGTITTDAAGNIASLDSVNLVINQGSVAYDGTTEGSGSAQAASLQDTANSAGSLSLNF
jgi:hypothetical protein